MRTPVNKDGLSTDYYLDKTESLQDLFGPDVSIEEHSIRVGTHRYPVIQDVIIALDPSYYTNHVRNCLSLAQRKQTVTDPQFDEAIQQTFGQEWTSFSKIHSEYSADFLRYFDLVDLEKLATQRVLDLGCGAGRWSHFVAPRCKSLTLVDFSDAIFVARENLRPQSNVCFVMADLCNLPFRGTCADFAFSLGVLHHLPIPALDAVRRLGTLAPEMLVYLYYALDNRGPLDRWLLLLVTRVRLSLSRIRNESWRLGLATVIALAIYLPLVNLGRICQIFSLGRFIPLYEGYRYSSFQHMRQDAYDRFFTTIEQRVSQREIFTLRDTFDHVQISPCIPYWHFLCSRSEGNLRTPAAQA